MPPIFPHGVTRALSAGFVTRLAQVGSLVRARSPQDASLDDESLERYRKATLGAIAGAISRVVSLLTVFVSIPVVLTHLGSQQFGLWATLASFTVLLNFADLGISNGLVNMLVSADADEDHSSAAEHVTSALALLIVVAALLGLGFVLVYAVVDWTAVYNTGPAVDADVAAHATAVFAGCFLVLLPLGLFQRIHLGYQEGFLTYAWAAAGSIAGLAGVLVATVADASLPWYVAATSGGPVLAALLNGLVLLGRSRPWLRPRPSRITRDSLRALANTGGAFFVIQSSFAVASYSGPIVVAQVMGAASVEDFAVPMRLFGFLPILLQVALTATWPALRSAILKGEIGWARRAVKRATWLGLSLLALPTLALVAFGDTILRLWTGDAVGASPLALISFGSWALLSAIVWPLWYILSATNALRVQAMMLVLMAVGSVAISVELAQRIGIAGVVAGLVVAELVFFVVPSAVYVPRLLSRLERATIRSS